MMADAEREATLAKYLNPDTGERLASVTTVCGIVNKPGLYTWYAKSAAQKAVDELIELNRKVEADGWGEAVDWLAGAAVGLRDGAATRGKLVHGVVDRYLAGQPIPAELPDGVRPLVDSALQFIADEGLDISHSEQAVLNPKVGYAGTFDWRGAAFSSFGEYICGDWKTGKSGPYRTWGLQLAAYAYAPLWWSPEGAVPAEHMSKTRAVIVKLHTRGYRAYWLDGQDGRVALGDLYNVFRAAKIVWDYEHGGAKLWS
jgi:hypothetical protein